MIFLHNLCIEQCGDICKCKCVRVSVIYLVLEYLLAIHYKVVYIYTQRF